MKKQGSSDKFEMSSGKSPSPERRKSVHFGSEVKAKPMAALKRLKSDNLPPGKQVGSGSSDLLEIPNLDKKSSGAPIHNIIKPKAKSFKRPPPQYSDINIEETLEGEHSSNDETIEVSIRRQSILP